MPTNSSEAGRHETMMSIAIMGTGGVGGYYGARLAAAGHRVVFIARGEHAAVMRRSGLVIESALGGLTLDPVEVVDDVGAAAVGPVDLVIVAVKLWDTEVATRAIAPLIGASTCVVSLQNGIDKDALLAGRVGREHVLGGVTYILANLARPGVVVHVGRIQRILLGELDGGTSQRVTRIVAALAGAGIDAEASPDIRRATFEKFIFLATNSALTAVTRRPIGELRADPNIRPVLRDAMREIVHLARAEGVTIDDGFVEDRMQFIDSLPAGGRASMAHDLLHGRRLELDWLSGAVVRGAARHGLEAPIHRTLYAALVPFAGGPPIDAAP